VLLNRFAQRPGHLLVVAHRHAQQLRAAWTQPAASSIAAQPAERGK
jgi:diadenosine tetraphosphate (Ap4A) HIT family hydrolase